MKQLAKTNQTVLKILLQEEADYIVWMESYHMSPARRSSVGKALLSLNVAHPEIKTRVFIGLG
jgi:hypothetical protein